MTFTPAVSFDYNAWITRFPEFANVSEALATAYFEEAEMFCANTVVHRRARPWMLAMLLNLLTAHIAWLYAPRDANGNPSSTGGVAPQTVGQMTNATEGSVNITLKPQSFDVAEWYAQTKYGYEYWQATAAFRTMRYRPLKTHVPSSIYPFVPGPGFWIR